MKTITNIVLCACLVCCGYMVMRQPPDDVKPDDPQTTATIAQRVPTVIAALQAENYTECVKQLRAGTLKGEVATGEWLAARNKAAIDAAYKPLDVHLQSVLGEGKYTDELAAATYDGIAAGLLKAGAK